MKVLYREEISDIISKKLRLSKTDTDLILHNYCMYMQERLYNGKTINVLNICYIVNNDESAYDLRETLAYTATEIANKSNMGSETVLRVLSTLGDMLVSNTDIDISYCLRGLIRVRYIKNDSGFVKPRIRKSNKFTSDDNIRLVTTPFFRRKVGESNAG